MKSIIAMAAFAAFLAPVSAMADEWEEQVHDNLVSVGLDLTERGWDLDRPMHLDRMELEETEYLTLNLSGYSRYAIMAACDTDCGNLDLYLYNEDDELVGQDDAIGEVSFLEVTPEESGDYRLMVRMCDCLVEPCRYGVALYSD